MNLNELVKNVVISKVCSISPDKDSDNHKSITLRVKFDDVILKAVFDKAVSQVVIQWQNGPGRKKFDSWKNNQVIDVSFKAPAVTQVDPMSAFIAVAKADGIDMSDEEALAKYIKSKL
jgi:hypothetical protein